MCLYAAFRLSALFRAIARPIARTDRTACGLTRTKKTNTETICSRARRPSSPCVQPDRESRIGVAEPFLCCLDIDPLLYERGQCIGAAEIVELQARASDDERREGTQTRWYQLL